MVRKFITVILLFVFISCGSSESDSVTESIEPVETTSNNTSTTTKTQEMKTMDVISCVILINNFKVNLFKRKQDEIQNCTSPNRINITKELYKRLIVPLYIPTLMLVPYLLILSSKEKLNYKKLKLSKNKDKKSSKILKKFKSLFN